MPNESPYQAAYKAVTSRICLDELEAVFTKLDNDYSRVEYILKEPRLASVFARASSITGKDLGRAKAFKDEGNKWFQKKNHAAALSAYNKAIRLCPPNELKEATQDNGSLEVSGRELIAVCYANRSAVLFYLQQYKHCLSDVERAIQHGYPNELLYKLMVRRAKCMQYVGDADSLSCAVTAAVESLSISNLNESAQQPWRKDLEKVVSSSDGKTTNGPNPAKYKYEPAFSHSCNADYPSLTDQVKVAENNEFGRYVEAVEDISAGTTVLIERPYCSVNLPEYYLTHCCHCQARVEETTLIPCQYCADVIYCSEECQLKSWMTYHQYECGSMHQFKSVKLIMGHLACRTALSAGIEALMSLLHDRTSQVESVNARYSYLTGVYTLEGHSEQRSPKDLIWRTVIAVLVAHWCDVERWGGGNDKALPILAAFILHNLQVLPCNAHEISELSFDRKTPYLSELLEIGAGIYVTLSYFNHACDPTVVRSFCQGNICVVKTLSPVDKHEQLFDNYGCLYATHSLAEREEKMMGQYYFKCCCVACLNNWPMYTELSYDSTPMYKCPQCGSLVISDTCDKCSTKLNLVNTRNVLVKAKAAFDDQLAMMFASFLEGDALEQTCKKLTVYSDLANKLVFRPYRSLNDCQEALKHLYNLYGNISFKN